MNSMIRELLHLVYAIFVVPINLTVEVISFQNVGGGNPLALEAIRH
jgi:hypothetical protein